MFRRLRLPHLFAALTAAALLHAQDKPATLQAGAEAPDFVAKTLDGHDVRLSDYRGKIVVLDFWATWCGPCVASMPHVQEAAKGQHGNGVVVLAVCTSDTRKKFEAWMRKHQSDFPDIVFACDPFDRGSSDFDERASNRQYHVTGLPTKFVIGKDGRIALTVVGCDEGDCRLEAGLARAGAPIDAEVAKRGEAQVVRAAEEEAQRAAEAAANPLPSFVPRLMGYDCGDALPDLDLLGADGKEFKLSALRGKPVVVIASSAEGMPMPHLQRIAARFGHYGVTSLAMVLYTSREDYLAWAGQQHDDSSIVTGGDPAGVYLANDDQPDPAAQMAHHMKSLLGRLFGNGMYPAMPFAFVLDRDGKVVGSFFFDDRKSQDGLANMLLHAGVALEPNDMPKEVAAPAAFVVAPPPPPEAPVQLLAVGSDAPDFAAQDLAGKTVKLSDYAGKIVVLDFWATWCGPCKASLPHTQEVAKRYQDQGVVVLANCTSDARAAFERWVRIHLGSYSDIVFTHDAAEKKPERASRRLYGVSGIPQQFVIGKDGKVVAVVDGYMEGEVLLEGALAKAGVDVDPAILQKAAADQKKRDDRRAQRDSVPGIPMTPMRPAGG